MVRKCITCRAVSSPGSTVAPRRVPDGKANLSDTHSRRVHEDAPDPARRGPGCVADRGPLGGRGGSPRGDGLRLHRRRLVGAVDLHADAPGDRALLVTGAGTRTPSPTGQASRSSTAHRPAPPRPPGVALLLLARLTRRVPRTLEFRARVELRATRRVPRTPRVRPHAVELRVRLEFAPHCRARRRDALRSPRRTPRPRRRPAAAARPACRTACCSARAAWRSSPASAPSPTAGACPASSPRTTPTRATRRPPTRRPAIHQRSATRAPRPSEPLARRPASRPLAASQASPVEPRAAATNRVTPVVPGVTR